MRRKDFPEALTNLTLWPGVDANAMTTEAREQYRTREATIRAYFTEESVTAIAKRLNIAKGTISRLVERCIAPHPDGRIQGFRGLIPQTRVRAYVRVKAPKALSEHGGLVGAFGQLLDQHPNLAGIIERQISSGDLRLSANGRLVGLRRTQDLLLSACRQLQFNGTDYPLSQEDKAYRSLARFARSRLEARVPTRHAAADAAQKATLQPFSMVELDGHKLDVRLRVRFTEPSGLAIDLEIERLFVLVLIDVCTRAVLGWQLVLASEYDRFDVLLTIQNALTPRRKRHAFCISGLTYEANGGFVSEVCPQTAYACWTVLKFDNAKAHLAEDTLTSLCEFVGCRVDAGPVRQPTQRPFIERFFRTLTDRLSLRLPGTTGNRPNDDAGKKGKQVPVAHLITIPELEELLEVTIANYNGTPHDGLNGRTPLEAMQFLIDVGTRGLRTLPLSLHQRIHQLQPAHLSTVRGNPARSVAPFISLYGARYSNEVLERTQGLLKSKIRIYLNPDDMREAWAYLPSGAELGRLCVLDGWRYSRHTLRLRQHILKLRRRGKLQFADDQDPVQVYSRYQRSKTRHNRKEATRTAQVVSATATASPVSPAVATPRRPRDQPILPTPLPDLDVQNY